MGIDLPFGLLSTLFYGEGGKSFFYLVIITNRTSEDTRLFLLLKGGVVLKPAFKSMPICAEQIKSNHFYTFKNNLTLFHLF